MSQPSRPKVSVFSRHEEKGLWNAGMSPRDGFSQISALKGTLVVQRRVEGHAHARSDDFRGNVGAARQGARRLADDGIAEHAVAGGAKAAEIGFRRGNVIGGHSVIEAVIHDRLVAQDFRSVVGAGERAQRQGERRGDQRPAGVGWLVKR